MNNEQFETLVKGINTILFNLKVVAIICLFKLAFISYALLTIKHKLC